MSVTNSTISTLKQKYADQPEFLQTADEVLTSLDSFLLENPKYIDSGILEMLVEPERIIQFRVPWVNDQGKVEVNTGYRVQFNSALGPYKGGLRFHPSVNLSILKFLGFEQIFKNSLTGLPIGGGKGGSDFNPKGKSDMEVMRFCQSFMTELSQVIGENTDVPAGDIGVGAREIGYLFGQYKKINKTHVGVLTGKGIGWGGSQIRTEATGYGLVYFVQNILENLGDSYQGKNVAVSGSGNVAQFTAQKILELGGKVISLSDSGGTVYMPDGLNTEQLEFVMQLKNVRRGRIQEFANQYNLEFRESQRPWSLPEIDIALPCATQNEIEVGDAKALLNSGVKVVGEGANMPTTKAALELLQEANIIVAPAKAANAGGVGVSGLEMAQNSQRLYWSSNEVDQKLKVMMEDIYQKCKEYGTDKHSPLTKA